MSAAGNVRADSGCRGTFDANRTYTGLFEVADRQSDGASSNVTATVTNSNASHQAVRATAENIRQFLQSVVVWPGNPQAPGYINMHVNMKNPDPAKKGGKPFVVGWPYKHVNEFLNRALWVDNSDSLFNVWICMSQQSEAGGTTGKPKAIRRAANATAVKAIWIDCDVKAGEPNHYQSLEEARSALADFAAKMALPLPSAVVNSGGGLHVYWISDKELTPDEWRPYAEGLKALLVREGIKCDTPLTTDIARLLRVPGTLNHKYTPARRVELVELGRPYAFATELSVLPRTAPAKSSNPARSVSLVPLIEPGRENEFAGGPDPAFAALSGVDSLAGGNGRSNAPLDPGPVFEECGFMRHARNTGGADYEYPLWHLSMLCTVFMENGNAIAHEISKGHPTYDHGDAQRMYERKVADRDQGVGYPRCATIHGAGCKSCASCPLLNKIKSPLNLAGPTNATVNPSIVEPATTNGSDEANLWLSKLSPSRRKEVIEFAARHVANNSSRFALSENGRDHLGFERLLLAVARNDAKKSDSVFDEAASSNQDADAEEPRQFNGSCDTGSPGQDGISADSLVKNAREFGADFGPWEHVAATSTSTAIFAPGAEQTCRELLDRVVAADGHTFTLGDRSGPLVILRKPEEDALPSNTKWQSDLPAATLAKSADIMMRAERLTWLQRAGGKSDDRFIRTGPPRAFINDYLDQMRGLYAAPPLLGMVRVPRIDDRGAIHFTPGYDAKTSLFHDRVPGFYVPLTPGLNTARQAAEALLFPFSKYKFEDSQVGNALVLAAIFTALERPFIPVAPMFVVRSSMPGTGKGLIVNTLASLAFDTKPVVITWGGNSEEFEKRLAALLLQAPAVLSVDNANGMQITGDLLESIITEGSADIRPLGRSETVRVRNRSLLMLTGNNPVITGDMARRALSINILPQSSDPERDRYAFHPVTVVSQRRREFLQAAFTAMRAFRLAGMPEHGLPAAGSFDQWSRKVRDLVYWITDYDVAEGFRQNKAEDPRLQADAALLTALFKSFGSKPFRAAEVMEMHGRVVNMRNSNGTCKTSELAVHEALENVLGGRGRLTAKLVGIWARRVNGVRMDGYLLETHQNSSTHANEITIREL